MNTRELALVGKLVRMREDYGVVGLKTEFEAEGATFDEVVRLTQVACRAGLWGGVALKIGGPEDVWGIKQAVLLDARDVVAPMVEGPYALTKFLKAYHANVPEDTKKELAPAVNIETAQAYRQIDKMLAVGRELGLHCVTVGRVDMAESFGWGRKAIDSEAMFKVAKDICRKARRAGLRVTIGGAIERGSREILEQLISSGILDCFETRKVKFRASLNLVEDEERYAEAIRSAHQVEISWLENRKTFNTRLSVQDDQRLEMLRKRIEQ